MIWQAAYNICTSGPDVFGGESVMQTTSSLTWSRHPEPNLIGVSVFQNQNHFSLRFHIRTTHLEQIKNPKTRSIVVRPRMDLS